MSLGPCTAHHGSVWIIAQTSNNSGYLSLDQLLPEAEAGQVGRGQGVLDPLYGLMEALNLIL